MRRVVCRLLYKFMWIFSLELFWRVKILSYLKHLTVAEFPALETWGLSTTWSKELGRSFSVTFFCIFLLLRISKSMRWWWLRINKTMKEVLFVGESISSELIWVDWEFFLLISKVWDLTALFKAFASSFSSCLMRIFWLASVDLRWSISWW